MSEVGAIQEEGKALYKTEMASWQGTDVFLEQFPDQRARIGGYFSYSEGDETRCLFFDTSAVPGIIAILSFDSTFSPETIVIDSVRKRFSVLEEELYFMRQKTLEEIQNDSLFVHYKNTNFNIIPLLWKGARKVYVLTGPQVNNVVVFGNDYLLTFDEGNNIISKKKLHTTILPAKYGDDDHAVGGVHSHLPQTGDYFTATDICTLMLYGKYTGWSSYSVVSDRFISIWNCETNTQIVITQKAFKKASKNRRKREKRKDRN